jgi:hypothetical protein
MVKNTNFSDYIWMKKINRLLSVKLLKSGKRCIYRGSFENPRCIYRGKIENSRCMIIINMIYL